MGTYISLINLDKNNIFNELRSIKLNTSPDTNGICSFFLKKECAFVLIRVIHFLFNKSLESGIFPDKWKTLLYHQYMKRNPKLLSSIKNVIYS